MDNMNREYIQPVLSGIAGFLRENAEAPEQFREVVVSERFRDADGKPIPFRLRVLMGDETQRIRDTAVIGKGKNTEFRSSLYFRNLVIASVVEPNLNNAELQNSYGVMSPADLLNKMLTGDEYGKLSDAVLALNGGENYRELVDDAKNE